MPGVGHEQSEWTFTQTNTPMKFYSCTDYVAQMLQHDEELELGALYFITDRGIIYGTKLNARNEVVLTSFSNQVQFFNGTAAELEVDDEGNQDCLYVTLQDQKFLRCVGYHEYEEISPTPFLGNGDTTDSDASDGADINSDPTQADSEKVVSEKQVSKFVADQIALISAGIGSVHHAPVADLAALAALASEDQTDKEIILVEADNAIWRWDAEATTAPSAQNAAVKTVVLPTDLATDYGEDPTTPGRWIKLLNGASLTMTNTTPASIGFEDPNNDNVYTPKAATAGVSTEVARADHVHELVGVARVDQLCWSTITTD